MYRADLEHIIRASCEVLGQDQVIVIGSQAILGTYGEYELPEQAVYSEEADILPMQDGQNEEQADQLSGTIGEFSPFHETHGYYAHGVSRRTALLPIGWEERLIPIRNENTRYRIGWCLEPHDLCCAKLLANREKDRDFVSSLIEHNMVSTSTIRERVMTQVHVSQEHRDIALAFLNTKADNASQYRPPLQVEISRHEQTAQYVQRDPGTQERQSGYPRHEM